MDPIHIYIGTQPGMERAESALRYSISRNVSGPVSIVWMRASDPGWDDWRTDGWYTSFTCFRFAIPFLARMRGRAIYIDVDTLVLQDLRELWERRLTRPVAALNDERTDVMLIDCEAFTIPPHGWPDSLAAMKTSGDPIDRYLQILRAGGWIEAFDPKWNVIDGTEGEPLESIGVIHYSRMSTQPWQPYPDRFDYKSHPRPDLSDLWWRYHALAEALNPPAAPLRRRRQ